MKKILILLILISTAAPATTVSEVETNIMCTCNCSMALYTCECGTSDQMRREIQARIDQGWSKDQIVQAYVGQYGEAILSAPTKEGFNLTAWVTPFLALLFVGGLVYRALRRWSRTTSAGKTAREFELKEDDSRRLEQELEKLEEGEV